MKIRSLRCPIVERESLLREYVDKVFEMNEKINLVSRMVSKEVFWEEMVIDSLFAKALLPRKGRVLDIGSGGGVPVIPLAIETLGLSFVALESSAKKSSFLKRLCEETSLANVSVSNSRAEAFAKGNKGVFSVGTAKGVAELRVLLEYFAPLIRRDGELFLYKGPSFRSELALSSRALSETGFSLEAVFEYKVAAKSRYLLHFRKQRLSLAKFPREIGEAKKSPI